METDLDHLEDALSRFHHYREIFISTGIRSNFSLPRQHSLVHYLQLIRLFGAPNGICTSISESKHRSAVKEPWRLSSRNEALGQMLVMNQRRDQLAAARTDFVNRGMLEGTCLDITLQAIGGFQLDYTVYTSLIWRPRNANIPYSQQRRQARLLNLSQVQLMKLQAKTKTKILMTDRH